MCVLEAKQSNPSKSFLLSNSLVDLIKVGPAGIEKSTKKQDDPLSLLLVSKLLISDDNNKNYTYKASESLSMT